MIGTGVTTVVHILNEITILHELQVRNVLFSIHALFTISNIILVTVASSCSKVSVGQSIFNISNEFDAIVLEVKLFFTIILTKVCVVSKTCVITPVCYANKFTK